MTKFQVAIIGLFIVFVVGGLLIFASFKGKTSTTLPTLTVWGTLDQVAMNSFFQNTVFKSNNAYKITYQEKRAESMYQQYTEALITGRGPDILLLPHDELLKYQSKITPIPYASYSEKDFKSIFIQEGELYLLPTGIAALPFTVDPLVLYWNRDMFSNALISKAPKYWPEALDISKKLTMVDASKNIIRSGLGMGEYRNVDHAKEILSLLMMQAGTPITARNGNAVESYISVSNGGTSPSVSALQFYTSFADVTLQSYSWNRSLPSTKNYFISNKLGMYVGFGSENAQLRALNPNLNYDIAVIPQVPSTTTSQPINTTYGKLYGFSISAGSQNAAAALQAIEYISTKPLLSSWVAQSGLGTVRRDSLSVDASSAASTIIATSALWSRGWLDPNTTKTSLIFQDMIESVTSRRSSVSESVGNAGSQLHNLTNP